MIRLDAYEYENETSIDSKLICPICLQPFYQPNITLCEHIFCHNCIEAWHAKSATCPLCREISKDKYTRSVGNPALLKQLDGLPVTCLLCHETGIKRGDLDVHRVHHCLQRRQSSAQDPSEWSLKAKGDDLYVPHLSRLPFKFHSSHQRRIIHLIKQAPTHSKITLRDEQLTDADMSLVVRWAIEKKQCKILDLGNNIIISYGIAHLADCLEKNTTLKILSLHQNPLAENGMRYLANKLAKGNVHLKWLDLESANIWDSGAEHLASMLTTNRSLSGLWLSNNHIGYRGVAKIASALSHSNTTLKYLDLENNQSIDDACLSCLLNMLKENRSLKTVYLNRCQLSMASKKKLRDVALTRHNFHLVL